jgi:hypothetical protein
MTATFVSRLGESLEEPLSDKSLASESQAIRKTGCELSNTASSGFNLKQNGGQIMLRKLKLFKRFPRLIWKEGEKQHIIDSGVQGQYPDLAADFAVLDKQLMPYFWELDAEALRAQNQFWLEQVFLIIFTAIVTILGAIQVARPNNKLPGIVQAVLSGILGIVIFSARSLKTHESYFTNRLKAEGLRGEYFMFLGRAVAYSNDTDRVPNLIRRVADIRAEEIKYERPQ